MANRTKFTREKRETFLNALREMPNISKAARVIGISRRALYDARQADEEFRKDWDDAVDDGVDAIEEELHRRAVEGIEEQHYKDGKLVSTLTRYSDVLLIFYLKALRPDKYRERQEIQASGEVTIRLVRSDDAED